VACLKIVHPKIIYLLFTVNFPFLVEEFTCILHLIQTKFYRISFTAEWIQANKYVTEQICMECRMMFYSVKVFSTQRFQQIVLQIFMERAARVWVTCRVGTKVSLSFFRKCFCEIHFSFAQNICEKNTKLQNIIFVFMSKQYQNITNHNSSIDHCWVWALPLNVFAKTFAKNKKVKTFVPAQR
jgi:hypothetical protein